jgi:cytidylate kinase
VLAHFDRDIDDPLEYDVVLNTDNLSDEEAARAIAGLVLKD